VDRNGCQSLQRGNGKS